MAATASVARADSVNLSPDARRPIVCLSDRDSVNMANHWFEIATLDHFWIARRFDVLQRVFGDRLRPGLTCGEVGCGTGLLQRQLEDRVGVAVDGFELGSGVLERNESSSGALYYYNVFDRCEALRDKYDVLFLFDVLEHIEDEDGFLRATLFHLKPGGVLVVNVPARRELYSNYDRTVGHVRRYRLKDFAGLAVSHQLTLLEATYWGLPFYLLLVLRRLIVSRFDALSTVETGFRPPSRLVNRLMKWFARLEVLPQHVLGTSIMVAFRKSQGYKDDDSR